MDAQGELRVRGVSPVGEKLFLFFIFRPKKILTHVPHPCSTTFAFRTPSGAKRAPRSTTDRSRGDRNSTPCSGFTTGTSRYWFFCDRSCPDDTVLTSLSGLSPLSHSCIEVGVPDGPRGHVKGPNLLGPFLRSSGPYGWCGRVCHTLCGQ